MRSARSVGEVGPQDGVWLRECRYQTARKLTNTGSYRHPPIKRAAVLQRVDATLDLVKGDRRAQFGIGGRTFAYDQLAQYRTWLESESGDLERPLPAPDIDPPGARLVTDMYSQRRMSEFCAEMLGQGLQAYDELADSLLATFGWSLAMKAVQPLGAVGTVVFDRSAVMGPPLMYRLLPMGLMTECLDPAAGFIVSANGRAAIHPDHTAWPESPAGSDREGTWERLTTWLADHPGAGPFAGNAFVESLTVIDCQHPRPASLLPRNPSSAT